MFTVRITEWANGAPIERRRTEVNSKEEGMENLRALGHSWDLNPEHWDFPPMAGYLYQDEKIIGRLDVFKHTYHVYEVEA